MLLSSVVFIDGSGEHSSTAISNPGCCCCCRRKEGRIGLFISGSLLVGCPELQRVLSSKMIVNAQTTPEIMHVVVVVSDCLPGQRVPVLARSESIPGRRAGLAILRGVLERPSGATE